MMDSVNTIEKVTVGAGSPLDYILEDYAVGELTVLYDRHTDTQRELIFAVVELLPSGLEPGPDIKPCRKLGGTDRHELNLRRWHLRPDEAVAWYTAAGRGAATVPALDLADPPLLLRTGILDHEPPWSTFAFESEPFWKTSPLWGERPGGNRINQLLAVAGQGSPETLWTETERNNARSWLEEDGRLPIDVFERSVLWGSINLILPNPIFRSISERLANEAGTEVGLDIEAYPGKTVAGLEAEIHEYRAAGITIDARCPLSDSRTLLVFPHEVDALSVDIICPKRGLLFKGGTAAFIRQVLIQMDLVVGNRQINAPGFSKSRPAESYSVPVISPDRNIEVGESVNADARMLARRDRGEASRIAQSADLGLRWFLGNHSDATAFVRETIRRARTRVTIVDPHFDIEALARFGFSNGRKGTTIRLLTSKMHLRDGSEEGKTRARERSLKRNYDLALSLDPGTGVEIRVMPGATAPIHDRFLIVDEEVWLLGSSLNAFGERGTTAVRLPHAAAITTDIDEQWSRATPLAAFVESDSKNDTE